MKTFFKYLITILIAICTICLSSCETISKYVFYRPGTLGRTEFYEAFYIIDVNVPAFNSYLTDANRFDKVELIEIDEYGRSMFRYLSHVGTVSGDWKWKTYLTTLVICQKTENGRAYYYADFCWLGKASDQSREFAEFTADEITLLKERNDWNEPLDSTKMRSGLYKGNRDITSVRDGVNFPERISGYLELEDDENRCIVYHPLEKNESGAQVIWVRVDENQYFCIQNFRNYSIQACEPFDGDILNCQEALHEFKEKYGFYESEDINIETN